MGLQRDLGHLWNQPADRETYEPTARSPWVRTSFNSTGYTIGKAPSNKDFDTLMKSWYYGDA